MPYSKKTMNTIVQHLQVGDNKPVQLQFAHVQIKVIRTKIVKLH